MWAISEISLPSSSEWYACNTQRLEDIYPGFLFFFVDGTVLPIFAPSDIQRYKKTYNVKHSTCTLSYFIVCAPDGRIVYVSMVDSGSTHDASAWDDALKFPPIDSATGEERADEITLVEDLEEFYGVGANADETNGGSTPQGKSSYPFQIFHIKPAL